jgi:hypothetical protein
MLLRPGTGALRFTGHNYDVACTVDGTPTHSGYVQNPTSASYKLVIYNPLPFGSLSTHDHCCTKHGNRVSAPPMKKYGSNQARLFDSRLLFAPASGNAPASVFSDSDRGPCSEPVSIATEVRGALLGILLMHVVLIGVILACAALAQS